MNRFEQRKPNLGRKLLPLLSVAIFLVLLLLFLQGLNSVSEATLVKQQESLETAIERSVMQCYAVEGVYPPSLEYLTTHYGITYDEELFFVDYIYYGGNLLPEYTVIRRSGT